MSRTSIEVAPAGVAVPDVVAKGSTHELLSIRPSLQSSIQPSVDNISAYDGISLHSLERTETITSKSRTVVIIASVTLITAISTLLNGLTTVALPTIADELHIPDGVLLWPSSIQALTCGCTLLLSGSVADVLGARFMYLLGCVLQAGFILGCGLSRTATQIIVFRGLSGIAISCCLPSAVSIITKSFDGRRRNMAFAAMGGGQPVGFSVGLALGGVLTDTIGWRWGFYSAAIFNSVVFAIALWGLPKSVDQPQDAEGSTAATWSQKLQQLKNEIDWVGALIASSLLAMFSYVFASLTGSVTQIRQPSTIAILVTAFLLIPTFIFWVGRQEKLGKPAIIPNSLWRNQIFTIICISVFFIWGAFNAFETILTFYFQRVQLLTAIQSSLRFLPAPVAGAVANIAMGLLVHRVPANWLAVIGCTISAAAPLVMVFATPQSSYWSSAFLANAFNPAGADSLFTISNLVITSVFPVKTQALAGGVFNSISQMGKSVGLALVAVIAATVTAHSKNPDKTSPEALFTGYKATFWFCFSLIMCTLVISTWGLRKIGMVGHKRD